jgi:hypothetical protein
MPAEEGLPASARDVLAGLDPKDLAAMVEQLADEKVRQRTISRTPEYIKKLREAHQAISESHQFEAGDLVKWKPNLKNKRKPDYDSPVIVVEILRDPIIPEDQGSGSAYFREPLDLLVGLLDEDEELVIIHVDSRRFAPYE